MHLEEQAKWLVLRRCPGLGAASFKKIVNQCPDVESLWQASGAELVARGLFTEAQATSFIARRRLPLDPYLEELRRGGYRVLVAGRPGYPSQLLAAEGAPGLLYLRGGPLPPGPAVAVVGTRQPTAQGLATAHLVGRRLAAAGFTVVSGLARGIDAAAHRGALAAGGSTIGVLGCGIDLIYPLQNRPLFGRVAAAGGLLSELEPGAPPKPHHFPVRNRIISGLSKAVVVIEAGATSGTWHTVTYALDQGREVFIFPWAEGQPQHAGLREMAGSAQVLGDVDELIVALTGLLLIHQEPVPEHRPRPPAPELEPEAAAIYGLIGDQTVRLEALVQQANRPVADLLATLTLLEIRGIVRRLPDQSYQRC